MVNPGAYYRCPEVCGGLFAVWEPNGAYNTVDTNVGAYNTVCVRAVEEHCLLCLSLVPSKQASPVEWPQSALVAAVGEEW